ncbi:TIGR04086 family membrane protein [Xylanibacillus composti]|nr:TIGR04086 family membrane protein [Xylanibacillus composti]
MRSIRVTSPLPAGLLYAFATMILCTLLVSLLLVFTSMREQSLSLYVYLIHGAALLCGGLTAGKRSGFKGWYFGGVTGLLYALLIVLVSFLGFDAGWSIHTGILAVMSFLIGAVGGMIGVNLRK